MNTVTLFYREPSTKIGGQAYENLKCSAHVLTFKPLNLLDIIGYKMLMAHGS